MTEAPSVGTLGEMLASHRRRRFVGRVSEVEMFVSALDSGAGRLSVLCLHGPGGIGKTALLEVFAELAEQTGARLVRIDGRQLPAAQGALLRALDGCLDQPVEGASRLVVLFDTYELLEPLDDWIRGELLPRLPASAITVLAGREPPSPAWLMDPAWRGLLRVVPLRNLDPAESRQYLRECGVDEAMHDRIVEVSHGHPLGLSLLADVVCRGGEAVDDPLTPDLVGTLLRQFIDIVPSPLHRRALEVCALARVTTEAALRDAMEIDDAHELFSWLRGLSFVESGTEGIYPHDLARDALEADLRWRDPTAYQRVFRGVRTHIWDRLTASRGREQLRAIFDQKFMFRHHPVVRGQLDWESWGQHYPELARPEDHEGIVELVRRWQGPEAASTAVRWLDRQPAAFSVIRLADGQLRGVLGLLDLTEASEQDIADDPATLAAWEFIHRDDPPRSGDRVSQWRYIIDRDAYQGPSPTWNAAAVLSVRHVLTTVDLSWYMITLAEPDQLADYFAFVGHPRAEGADFEIGGQRYGFYFMDWRQLTIDVWQDVITERALARGRAVDLPAAAQAVTLALSRAEFNAAVRQALHDLSRPDLLARNALQRTRLMASRTSGGEPNAAALADLIRKAVDSLREHPRDDKLLRAVDRTYVRPAATQERAAALLGLPFSTYRRHLSRSVDRIASWLWERELHGTATGSTEQH